ncbi:MAG TPA: hypothetical protein VFD27_19005 [Chthoniobacteraceae bacterium]|nr:hypothetical protein [Chthoniobacteraceae bacterium]
MISFIPTGFRWFSLALLLGITMTVQGGEPFALRGYYLTMMRMPVMGLPEWKEAVDCFAEDGANVVILWTAGGFRSRKFPVTWQHNEEHANVRADFVRELIDYAHTKGVRVLLGFTPFGYDGVNRFPLEHPELKARKADGSSVDEFGIHCRGWNLCPAKVESQRFMRDYIHEMAFEFYPNADGLLVESSDYAICHCAECGPRFYEREFAFVHALSDEVWKRNPEALVLVYPHYFTGAKVPGLDATAARQPFDNRWGLFFTPHSAHFDDALIRQARTSVYSSDATALGTPSSVRESARAAREHGVSGFVPSLEAFSYVAQGADGGEPWLIGKRQLPFGLDPLGEGRMPYRALLPRIQRFAFQTFSHEPELDFGEFERRLGQHIFGADSAAEKVVDLLELHRIWNYEGNWYWQSPLLDPEFFRVRMQRLKLPPDKLAQYNRNLDRLKGIADRYNAATNPGEREMARLAQIVIKRWGQETPTPAPILGAEERDELRVGIAGHAFDHLGAIGDQAAAAVASGMTIIYPACFGQIGYDGLPGPEEIEFLRKKFSAYLHDAKASGIKVALAYVCSTSIVRLETFDKNWSKEFRAQFVTPPAQWLQQDRDGKPLPSWYGGNYLPACMNNPDWRTYEKFMVKLQLESGNDGIFFDNPTVHPQGCYCEHCLGKFADFLVSEGTKIDLPATDQVPSLRQLATTRAGDFLRFRATIARDFLAEMRTYARTIKRDALITCNNSLNTPGALFSQCRTYGYNIHEMSKVEDLVVVEDMATQPRVLPDGSVAEYGPIYELLHAISHRKPVVACALADGDYHTAPNLVRLAMAEAAAHRASYLAWPTWPENVRQKMIAAIRPQADLLRKNASLLNGTTRRVDALLFLPFRRWVDTADCQPLKIAGALSLANVQFAAVCEDDLVERLTVRPYPVLLVESQAVLSPSETATIDTFKRDGGQVIWTTGENWLVEFRRIAGSLSIVIQGAPTIRAVVHDQPGKQIVHLLNLNVQRLSSFEDKVNPATDVRVQVRVPFAARSVNALSADAEATQGPVPFTSVQENNENILNLTIPRLDLDAILVITP